MKGGHADISLDVGFPEGIYLEPKLRARRPTVFSPRYIEKFDGRAI